MVRNGDIKPYFKDYYKKVSENFDIDQQASLDKYSSAKLNEFAGDCQNDDINKVAKPDTFDFIYDVWR